MSNSLKAALFSTLVFPGAGHFFLKKPIQGFILAAITVASICVLMVRIIEISQQISDRILSGEIPYDIARISEEVSKQVAGSFQLTDFTTWILIICWLVGIADSYRVGRLQEKSVSSDVKETHPGD
ncbi:MAG: hypothetical protein GY935_28175 [Gammaproteobacteria bacterium]|nr:hypothetical protein [Gammaproteobacteria bacterium]